MSRILPAMIDMARSTEDKKSLPDGMPECAPEYSYGLCLSFDQDTLEKLDLDEDDVEIGDMLELRVLAKVTSISKNDSASGSYSRVELQITHIAEDEDDDEEEEASEPLHKKLYKK